MMTKNITSSNNLALKSKILFLVDPCPHESAPETCSDGRAVKGSDGTMSAVHVVRPVRLRSFPSHDLL